MEVTGVAPLPPHQWRARARAVASSRQAKMRSPTPLGPKPVCRSTQARRRAAWAWSRRICRMFWLLQVGAVPP